MYLFDVFVLAEPLGFGPTGGDPVLHRRQAEQGLTVGIDAAFAGYAVATETDRDRGEHGIDDAERAA